MTRPWDLNADLGEGDEHMDVRLLEIITSANVACGGHAGDDASMRRICGVAASRGVAIGAQVSYVDREGFGRRRLDIPGATLTAQLQEQIGYLQESARECGVDVSYVKPHGALYHAAVADRGVAESILAASGSLPILTLPHGHLRIAAADVCVTTYAEAFADRAYTANGNLVPRDDPAAVITDPAVISTRVHRLVTEDIIMSIDGTMVAVSARSLCVHSDTPGADIVARQVRRALEDSGAPVLAFAPQGR